MFDVGWLEFRTTVGMAVGVDEDEPQAVSVRANAKIIKVIKLIFFILKSIVNIAKVLSIWEQSRYFQRSNRHATSRLDGHS